MESSTGKIETAGSGSGMVPDVLGQVGAGASPSVLPVQRDGGVDDEREDRFAHEIEDHKRHGCGHFFGWEDA
jgi:hypothetical protein